MNRDKNEELQEKIGKLYHEKYGSKSGDEVLIYLTEELIKGVNTLNTLTKELIKGAKTLNTLTIVLIVLTAVLIGVSLWKF